MASRTGGRADATGLGRDSSEPGERPQGREPEKGAHLSATDDAYNHSPRGRARAARYRRTAKRRAAQHRYNNSPKGRATWRRYYRRKGGWQKARQKPFGTAQFARRAA